MRCLPQWQGWWFFPPSFCPFFPSSAPDESVTLKRRSKQSSQPRRQQITCFSIYNILLVRIAKLFSHLSNVQALLSSASRDTGVVASLTELFDNGNLVLLSQTPFPAFVSFLLAGSNRFILPALARRGWPAEISSCTTFLGGIILVTCCRVDLFFQSSRNCWRMRQIWIGRQHNFLSPSCW